MIREIIIIICFIFSFKSWSVSEKEARDFCKKWFPSLVLGERDADIATQELLEKFYTKDSILIDPNFKNAQQGYGALRIYYRTVMSKYPNWSFSIEEIIPSSKGFVLHYIGSVPGIVERFRGVDLIDLEKNNGSYRIKKLVGLYDRTPFIRNTENEEN